MKKKSLKSLKLNRKAISNFTETKGGYMHDPSYGCGGGYVTQPVNCQSDLHYC